MDAAKCRLCGERHWSTVPCPPFQTKAAKADSPAPAARPAPKPVNTAAVAPPVVEAVNMPELVLDAKAKRRESARLSMQRKRASERAAKASSQGANS